MIKGMEENPCRNIGRIRRRINLIRERKDSNLLSIEITQIKIIPTSILGMNPRENTPWEKGEGHKSNFGDAKKITCTRISFTESKSEDHAQHPIGCNTRRHGKNICILR
jgi:hypothetical protein